MSMPQMCKQSLSSAISSLCVYTAVCKYFLICTPSAMHVDKKVAVNGQTYLRRGWCRFEQWARLATGGLQDMYVYRSDSIERLSAREFEPWVEESINVFSGEFNVDSQKQARRRRRSSRRAVAAKANIPSVWRLPRLSS